MSETATRSVSIIGLGMMGQALAGAFLGQGFTTTVWNRSAAKADELVTQGARRADSASAAAAASELVIVCLSTYETVHAVLTDAEAELAGRTLVNLTSGTPVEARKTAAWAAKRNIPYLGGAIMTIPPMIGQPHSLIFYGGEKSLFDKHEEALKILGGRATYLGTDTGVPMIYDVALLGILWTSLAGYLHALALVGTENVPAADFLPYAQAWVQHVALPSFNTSTGQVDAADYTTTISSLEVNRAAIAHLVDASVEQGISPELIRPIQAFIERRVTEGHAADSLASMIEAIRNPAT